MSSIKNKQRTYARNRLLSRRGYEKITESDEHYLLKLVFVLILGTLWIKFHTPLGLGGIPLTGLPVGTLFGLLIVHHFEKSQFNRKIWYAIMLIMTIVSYFLPAGIVI